MDSNTSTALPFADIAASLTTMIHNIGIAVAIALLIGIAFVVFNAVTSTKATTRPVRTFR